MHRSSFRLFHAIATIWILCLAAPAPAQEERPRIRLGLSRAIEIARSQSPSALVAMHRYRASYWQYVTFRADYRPSLDLGSTPMEWERTIARQTLPDGTDAFVPRSQANSSLDLALNKVVSWTGGRISLHTTVARTDDLEGQDGTEYSSTPVQLAYDQPLFSFNTYAWSLRIEPRRYAEARQQLVEDFENVSSTAISYFFDLLSAQSTLRDAVQEQARAETVLAVVRERNRRGRAPENDVLQAEVASLNADLRLTRAQVDADVKQQRIGTFLGVGEEPNFDLALALDVPRPKVDLATAVDQARRNRPSAMAWSRQLLEADRSVAQARASRGTTWLRASYGLSQATRELSQLYNEPRTDQQARLTLDFPILDWGRGEARVAVAQSQRELTRRQVEQSQSDFDRDVFLRVSQFDIQARQLQLSGRADSLAQRRYALVHQRYLSGESADLNALDVAQREKENARRGYLDAVRSYWAAYYDLRRATLYDFERGEALRAPPVRF